MEIVFHMMNIFKKLRIDYSTYMLMLIAILAGYIKNISIILIILLFHEVGHIIFFKLFNIEIEKIVIYPFGGVTTINKRIHERIYKDIICSLGGVMFQGILLVIFYLLYKNNYIVSSTYNIFKTYNTSVLLFNLLPIIPLDGSKLLFSICTKFLSFKLSYIIMIISGIISLIGFIIYNMVYKINDLVMYIFLFINIIRVIRDFKYIMNRFYLERIMYDHYYDGIINDCSNLGSLKINKYYYFRHDNGYINEKKYIKRERY